MTSPTPAGATRHARTTSTTPLGAEFGDARITVEERDATRAFLLLHGGAGQRTMAGFAELLAERTHSRVLVPTHPGFGGTPRPAELATPRDLAAAYIALLDRLELREVTVVGNSFGGWIAAEIALLGSARVREAVIVDGMGIVVEGHPVADVRGLSVEELHRVSFHDPGNAPARPAGSGTGPSPDVRALVGYAGPAMSDPSLLGRLGAARLPVHVIWGESDGIVDPGYGKAFAAAIPDARFTVLPRSGHLPQLETPQELAAAIIGVGD